MNGQALVELAIALPVILFGVLGFIEYGFLRAQKDHQDRATAVVASWAAFHPGASWHAIATHELPGCDVSVTVSSELADIVIANATCHYDPRVTHGLWDGLPISSTEEAALEPTPTASPEATP